MWSIEKIILVVFYSYLISCVRFRWRLHKSRFIKIFTTCVHAVELVFDCDQNTCQMIVKCSLQQLAI